MGTTDLDDLSKELNNIKAECYIGEVLLNHLMLADDHGRRKGGPRPHMYFEIISKKSFFKFRGVKTKFHHFWPPSGRFWENPLLTPPLEKILPSPMLMIFVFCPGVRWLQRILDVCQAYAKSHEIIFDYNKTVCMTFKAKSAKSTTAPLLKLGGQ